DGSIGGPIRRAEARGLGLALEIRLTAWIRSVNPARREFCNNAHPMRELNQPKTPRSRTSFSTEYAPLVDRAGPDLDFRLNVRCHGAVGMRRAFAARGARCLVL
ncbi:hypothetical protein, partial [Rhodovulum sulfidophilum]|uniref:hypothetical protein n=1 Tax=Rhodovulum sulfidophilum TaxID=35806 RepID=UPI003B21EEFE